MFLKIKNITSSDIDNAKGYFWEAFCEWLKQEKPWTYSESLVSRYFLDKNRDKYTSISHKKNLVFVGSSDVNISIDIEKISERGKSLLSYVKEEDRIIFEKYWIEDKWQQFYVLWTAKESIIKYCQCTLDDMMSMNLQNIEACEIIISDVEFTWRAYYMFESKVYEIYFHMQDSIICSVCTWVQK